jgi:hypothetical protein
MFFVKAFASSSGSKTGKPTFGEAPKGATKINRQQRTFGPANLRSKAKAKGQKRTGTIKGV